MTFRVLHTSDWHLGQNFYGKSRLAEHQAFFNWLLAQLSEQHIDAVIVAGDIFDTGTPPSYARELYFDFVVKLHGLACKLIVVAGNHDSVAMLGESRAVLEKLGCYVITQASTTAQEQLLIPLVNAQGEQIIVCAVPFIRPRDVLTSVSGQTAQEKQQQLQQAIAKQYQDLAQLVKDRNLNDCAMVATGHLTTVGASCSESVRDIYIGTLEAFPASLFPAFDYIALGHIHQAQQVAKFSHIRYCGSPIALSFDEYRQQKQVNIAEFEQGKLSQVKQLAIPNFQPLAMVKTDLTDLAQDLETAIAPFLSQGEQQTIWLDIELASNDYLQDITQRVEEVTKEYPVEVLLIRRAKQQQKTAFTQHKNTTLAELSLQQVFAARMAQESWQDEHELIRQQRLEVLFNQLSEQAMNPAPEDEMPEPTAVQSNEQALV